MPPSLRPPPDIDARDGPTARLVGSGEGYRQVLGGKIRKIRTFNTDRTIVQYDRR